MFTSKTKGMLLLHHIPGETIATTVDLLEKELKQDELRKYVVLDKPLVVSLNAAGLSAQQSLIFQQKGGTHVVPISYPSQLGEALHAAFAIENKECEWERFSHVVSAENRGLCCACI